MPSGPTRPARTIDRRLAEFGSQERTESIETPTMSRPADGRVVARMVELRAVQSGFPLYGTVGLQGGQTYSHALLRDHGALVRPELLTALGLRVGDQLAIGQSRFTIRGVITTEPGRRVGGFSLGPRVLIDYDDLPSAGLLGVGSRARRVVLVRAPESSSSRSSARCASISGISSSPRDRTDRTRTRWVAISIGPRTI